jgi:probable addiction module antidote protein
VPIFRQLVSQTIQLGACLEEAGDDAAFIAKAPGTIVRAKGMRMLAKETVLGRESLYKTLSGEGNPGVSTILKVIAALAIKAMLNKSVRVELVETQSLQINNLQKPSTGSGRTERLVQQSLKLHAETALV